MKKTKRPSGEGQQAIIELIQEKAPKGMTQKEREELNDVLFRLWNIMSIVVGMCGMLADPKDARIERMYSELLEARDAIVHLRKGKS